MARSPPPSQRKRSAAAQTYGCTRWRSGREGRRGAVAHDVQLRHWKAHADRGELLGRRHLASAALAAARMRGPPGVPRSCGDSMDGVGSLSPLRGCTVLREKDRVESTRNNSTLPPDRPAPWASSARTGRCEDATCVVTESGRSAQLGSGDRCALPIRLRWRFECRSFDRAPSQFHGLVHLRRRTDEYRAPRRHPQRVEFRRVERGGLGEQPVLVGRWLVLGGSLDVRGSVVIEQSLVQQQLGGRVDE